MLGKGITVSVLILAAVACDKKSEASLSEAREDAREGYEAAQERAQGLGVAAREKAAEAQAVAKDKLEVAGDKLEAAGDKLAAAGEEIGARAQRAAEFVDRKVTETGDKIDKVKEDLADPQLKATFLTAQGVSLSGDVALTQKSDGVHVSVEVKKAPPGLLAVHVHQTNNCSDITNRSMGAHFAPDGHTHGLPSAGEHHLGDLGNMKVGANGKGELDILVPNATLRSGDARSFAGRSVVIDRGVDDGKGESGNSGTQIACAPLPVNG